MDGNKIVVSTGGADAKKMSEQTTKGKQDIQLAVIDGNYTLTSSTEECAPELSERTTKGKGKQDKEFVSVIHGSDTLASTKDACARELSGQTTKGKEDIELAVMNGNNTLASTTEEGVQELSEHMNKAKEVIELAVMDVNNIQASSTEACARELSEQTTKEKHYIESAAINGNDTLASTTEACARELSEQTNKGTQDIELPVIDGNDTLASTTEAWARELSEQTNNGKQDIELAVMDGNDILASTTEACARELSEQSNKGKRDIELAVMDGHDTLASTTEACARELSEQTTKGKLEIALEKQRSVQKVNAYIAKGRQVLQSDTEAGREELSAHVVVAKRLIDQLNTKKDDENYDMQCRGLLRDMKDHYNTRLSHVTTSPLNDWVQARLDDIYMPPNLQLMVKKKGSFEKTDRKITDYKNVFLNRSKLNKHMFIQGEAGSGKSTLLAKLVMDWCSINTTKSFDTSRTGTTHNTDSDERVRRTHFFEDLTILNDYKFVFHITLRDSVKQIDILEMIKQQIIDSLYGKTNRDNAYKLLSKIMERERCLVLLDGLDEWTSHGGHYLPTLAESYRQCALLITTRPWKLTELKIPDSTIDILLQLEGVNEPFDVSKRLLACVYESNTSTDVENKQSEFELYIYNNGLYEQLVSPMMLSLIVQLWVEKIEIKGSKCEIYSLLMESLLKKANSETSEFQKPPFRCFSSTQYIEPNIEHVDRLAEAAFYLLFSDKRENSLVFSTVELQKYNLVKKERLDFSLKSGILSATRKVSSLRSSSSFSFIHKSMQEFLAAYYIARNVHLIDDVISRYVTDRKNAYLDISQVFIFLCGLDVSAANALSGMMNECDVASGLHPKYETAFQKAIVSGYREAVANYQTDICLKLSHVYINESNAGDCHSIWKHNKSSVICLDIDMESDLPGEKYGEPAPRFEFDLSSCHSLKSLTLAREWIGFKDSSNLASSNHPVSIILHCGDPAHCIDPSPVLSCLEKIVLRFLNWSSTWLHSLFRTLLTLSHTVECVLEGCKISPCFEGAVSKLFSVTDATIITGFNHNFKLVDYRISGPGLWKALYGLNIQYLSFNIRAEDSNAKHDSPLFQSLLSIKQLEQLSIGVNSVSPELLEILFSLKIKLLTLNVNDHMSGLVISQASMWHDASLLPTRMETIFIDVNAHPYLLECMYGLKIKRLYLCGNGERFETSSVSLLLNALSSLEQLEELSIIAATDSPGLWQAIFGMNIKILNIGTKQNGLKVKHVSSLLTTLSSLKQLDTILINVENNIPGLFEAFHDLKIKSLSWEEGHLLPMSLFPQKLSFEFKYCCTGLLETPYIFNVNSLSLKLWGRFDDLKVNQKSSFFKLLSATKQLERLCIEVVFDSIGLWEALHGLKIKYLELSGENNTRLPLNNMSSLSRALSSLTQLETLNMNVNVGHLDAIRGLNIKSLILNKLYVKLNELASLSQLILSLTHLESLYIQAHPGSPFAELSDALREIKSPSLSCVETFF